ncbi:SixA phosphatase family protein [Marinobacterium arenosum]|uniref:SixA phosphatase family protein n=1 Tax=Marinobacterium arenosum TaxID=2862496 RepID=UPI001C955EDF|nr:histidine phosphatase family protein [Marinobacterium arenosum]MBY4676940.1 histidine phosphatase family protein [Marinobacterium arenosum]
MMIYLMRHGLAEPFGSRNDELRELTEAGRNQVRAQFIASRDRLLQIEQIVHSPYLRARQTAQIGAELLGVERLLADDRLVPEADPRLALELLERDSDTTTLYVTHNPFVGKLIGLLCQGDSRQPEPMDTAMLAMVEADWPAAGLGRLRGKHAAPFRT